VKKTANCLKTEKGHSSNVLYNFGKRHNQRKIEAETWGVEGRKQARHLKDAGWSHKRIHRHFESRATDVPIPLCVGVGMGSGNGSSSSGEVSGGDGGSVGDGGGFDFDFDIDIF
jgi:hypothetical protein